MHDSNENLCCNFPCIFFLFSEIPHYILQKTILSSDICLKFRVRSADEMRLKTPRKWLFSFAILYFFSSSIMISCEALFLIKGIYTRWTYYFGPINGIRIGLSSVFIINGALCLALMKTKTRKHSMNFFCLLFAIGSLSSAAVLGSWDNNKNILGLINNFNAIKNDNYFAFTNMMSLVQNNVDGKPFYPLFPLSIMAVLMQSTFLILMAVSTALIFMCFNMWISIRCLPKSTESSAGNPVKDKMFATIGVMFILCGMVINLSSLFLPFIQYQQLWFIRDDIFTGMTLSCLMLYIGGFLSLSVSSSSKFEKRFVLLLFSLGIMGSTAFCLYNTSENLRRSHFR